MRYAWTEGEDRRKIMIGHLQERSIFLLHPLIINCQGFLFIRDELIKTLAVSLQEALYHLTVLFQEGAASGNDIDGECGRFKVAQVREDMHPHAGSLARVRRSEQ